MLRGAVDVLRRKQLRERYAGDLLWMLANAWHTNFTVETYTNYSRMIEGKSSPEEPQKAADRVRKAAEDMIFTFLPKTMQEGSHADTI